MSARRVICFLFHWRRKPHEVETHWYGARCTICGERWLRVRPEQPLGPGGAKL